MAQALSYCEEVCAQQEINKIMLIMIFERYYILLVAEDADMKRRWAIKVAS